MLRKYEAQHTDLCVDEALFDLQIKLVFAQAAPEARGYHARLWCRYVSTAHARFRGFRHRSRSYATPPLTRDFSSKATSTGNARQRPAVDGSHLIAERDLGRTATASDPNGFDRE
jgi:hypothetical protein